MISPVMMKGNKAGIRLIISPDATISQVVTCLSDKLQTTGRYYANIKPITVTFEGKDLTEDEKQQIIDRMGGIHTAMNCLYDLINAKKNSKIEQYEHLN